jgi:hypothetical protein
MTSSRQTEKLPAMTHIALLGGTRDPNARTHVSLIGGMDLDLRETQLAPETTITKVSLIGGVSVTLPETAQVQIRRFWLLGGKHVRRPAGDPNGPVVRIRSFGIVGGVRVQ